MKTFLYLAITVIAATSVVGQAVNVTSATQSYFLLSQAQFRQPLANWQLKIDAVNARGVDSLKFFDIQISQVMQKVESIEKGLWPFAALSSKRRECVLKYQSLLLSSIVTQTRLASCRSTLQSRVNYLTNTPKNYLTYADNAININLPRAIATCNTTYGDPGNETKLEECVVSNVETYSTQALVYFDSVERYLESSICSFGDYGREAITCAFKVQQEALILVGSVVSSIERCVEQSDNLCPCNNGENNGIAAAESVRNFITDAAK